MKKYGCVFIGLNTVDVIASVPAYPGEDEKLRASGIIVDGGGPAGTAACAFSACGGRAAIAAFVGNDSWRGFVSSQFDRFGVDHSLCRVREDFSTPVSLITVNSSSATRTIVWNSGLAPSYRLGFSRSETELVLASRCLHFDGHLMADARRLAAQARRRGVLVSYDCGSVKPGWEKLAAATDIFIASHRFAADIGLEPELAVRELARRFSFKVLAVTAGEKGVYYFSGGRVVFLKQKKYRSVDSTGCGDVFHGAFLASYLKYKDTAAALAFGQRVAGLKTRLPGGRMGIPEVQP